MRVWSLDSASFLERRADLAVGRLLVETASRAVLERSAMRVVRCSIWGPRVEIRLRSFAMETSSSVIGEGWVSEGALNFIVLVWGE